MLSFVSDEVYMTREGRKSRGICSQTFENSMSNGAERDVHDDREA